MSEAKLDWSKLSPAERRDRWRQLTAWVRWLVASYDPWVRLPDCWPRHESLRSELAFFQAWQEEIYESGDAYGGTSWHSALRAAANDWRVLAQCRHDQRPRQRQEPFTNETFQRHLEAATNGRFDRKLEGAATPIHDRLPRHDRRIPGV